MQLLCVGDIALANECIVEQRWLPPCDLVPNLHSKILFNWELPIGETLNPQPRTSGPRLLASLNSPQLIENWAPGFAALATNHVLDGGAESLQATVKSLRHYGFETLGAGCTPDEISKPIIWKTTEGVLAIINWVFPETHPDWMAIPGPNCWPGEKLALQTIQNLKQEADWVLLFVHWSDELFPYPRPEDRRMANTLIEMGADIIVGHHPHVVRGMEIIDSHPVFYSLGNFYFADIPDRLGGWISKGAPRNREGLGLLINLQRERLPEIDVKALWNTGKQVISDPYHRAFHRLNSVSRPLSSYKDNEYITWYLSKRARFFKWEAKWYFGVLRLGIRAATRKLLNKLFSA